METIQRLSALTLAIISATFLPMRLSNSSPDECMVMGLLFIIALAFFGTATIEMQKR